LVVCCSFVGVRLSSTPCRPWPPPHPPPPPPPPAWLRLGSRDGGAPVPPAVVARYRRSSPGAVGVVGWRQVCWGVSSAASARSAPVPARVFILWPLWGVGRPAASVCVLFVLLFGCFWWVVGGVGWVVGGWWF